MSISLMSAAWKLDMPASRKMILLAMCDWANDDGLSCHPSIKSLATRASISDRQAKRVVHDLIELGWVSVIGNEFGGAPGQTRQYRINVRAVDTGDISVTGDILSRVSSTTGRVTSATERGDTHVTQPTIDPPVKASTSKRSPKAEPLTQFDFTSWPEPPTEQYFADWLTLRKKKRAPVTTTVMETMGEELHKAVAMGFTVDAALKTCVNRGWQGLNADWLTNKRRENHGNDQQPRRESLAERAERKYREGEERDAAQRALNHD